MVNVAMNVSGVAGAYVAQLTRYKTAMTGNPGAIQAAAQVFNARAAGGHTVMGELGGAAAIAGRDWNSPSGCAFRGLMSDFSAQVEQVTTACSSAGTTLHMIASTLIQAKSSIDKIITWFTAGVQKLAAQAADNIRKCTAGSPQTASNPQMLKAVTAIMQRYLEDAIHALGRQALARASTVEADTNAQLAAAADELNNCAVYVTISNGARGFRSDYGNLNPWIPARSLTGLFGGKTATYDLQPQLKIPATTLGFAAMGLPFNTVSGAAFRLRQTAIPINGSMVTMTPGLAFMRTLTAQPRSFLGDAFMSGGADPAYTNVHYSDASPLDYAATLGVNTVTPTLVDWAAKKIGEHSGNALSMDSGLHPLTFAGLTPYVEGMLRTSELVAPVPTPADPDNNKYWQALLTRSGLIGAGVGIPITQEMAVDYLSSGPKINPVVAGLSFGLPAMQNVGAELLLGPPPPHPNDPLYAIPHNTGQWLSNGLSNLDHVLRSSQSPSDGTLLNLTHAGVLAGEAVVTPVLGTVLEASNPGRSINALHDTIGYVLGGPHPQPPTPIVPQWSTEHALNALNQANTNLHEVMYQPQITPTNQAVSAGVNTLDGIGHSLIGAGEHLLYPYAYAHGAEQTLTESIQHHSSLASSAFHRATGGWDAFTTPSPITQALAGK